MDYKFSDKKTSGSNTSVTHTIKFAVGAVKSEIAQNKELAKELHQPIIKTFEKQKVHSSFIDNIWDADLADMQLTNKFNKIFQLLLCY